MRLPQCKAANLVVGSFEPKKKDLMISHHLWDARGNIHTNNTFKLPKYRERIRIASFASK